MLANSGQARYVQDVNPFPPLIGVIHLPGLPGSPKSELSVDRISGQAADDAKALTQAGFDGIIVENFGDVPFFPTRVPPITVASMTACVRAVCAATTLPVGVNVLRNDGRSALAIAVASGASFIRINVHSGVKITDQGAVSTEAHIVLRDRSALRASHIQLWCDVDVKHAAPLGERSIGDEAEDLVERELADAVLVTGRGTGKAVDPAHLQAVFARMDAPLYAASGVTPASLEATLQYCHGVIVGSAIRQEGRAGHPLVPSRMDQFVTAFRNAYATRTNRRGS